jgi:hypothetical protein
VSHYEKIAVVIIRSAGCCLATFALVAVFYNVLVTFPKSIELATAGVYSSAFFFIVGIALFVLGKPLAHLAARGIGKE